MKEKPQGFAPSFSSSLPISARSDAAGQQSHLEQKETDKKEEKKAEPSSVASAFKFAVPFPELEKATEYLANKESILEILANIQTEMTAIEKFFPIHNKSLYYPGVSFQLETIDRLIEKITKVGGLQYGIYRQLKDAIVPLQKEVRAFFLQEEGISDAQLLAKTQALYAQQALLMRDEGVSKSLSDTLQAIQQSLPKVSQGLRCFISYAWPTADLQPKEYWLQPFLRGLHAHLKQAGIQPRLDIIDNVAGGNIVDFTDHIKTDEFALLICTESLVVKHHHPQFKVVQMELNLLQQKYDIDIWITPKPRVFPFLVSGSRQSSSLPHYNLYRTVRDWRVQSYLKNLEQLIGWICYPQGTPETYQKIWQDFYVKYSALASPMSDDLVKQTLALQWHEKEMKKLAGDKFYEGLLNQHHSFTSTTEVTASNKALVDKIRAGAQQVLIPEIEQLLDFYIEADVSIIHPCQEKDRFKLTPSLNIFLADPRAKTCAILGDSGSGKSLLALSLIKRSNDARQGQELSTIPIYIALKQFTVESAKQCVMHTLQHDYNLTVAEIVQLREGLGCKQQILFILDGFDEIAGQQIDRLNNLFQENHLGQWPYAKLLITCRTQYLPDQSAHVRLFSTGSLAASEPHSASFRRYYLSLFSDQQIAHYLERVVTPTTSTVATGFESPKRKSEAEKKDSIPAVSSLVRKSLTVAEYQGYFMTLPGLKEIISNPFLLYVLVKALPQLLDERQLQNMTTAPVTRSAIYTAFMNDWFERETNKLRGSVNVRINLRRRFESFAQYLAFEMFTHRLVEVNYQPKEVLPWESETTIEENEMQAARTIWEKFFSSDAPLFKQARDACPLRHVGDHRHSFIHKSFWEYFIASHVLNAMDQFSDKGLTAVLKQRNLREEPAVLLFLTDSLQASDKELREKRVTKLQQQILLSKTHKEIAQASANAATILNWAGEMLTWQLWADVQLPGADLSYCVLAHSDLKRANLQGANLSHAMLYKADLRSADLRNVQWGEFPCLKPREKESVRAIAYHPTKPWLAITQGKKIVLMHRDTGECIGNRVGHTHRVTSVVFSPDGTRLASGSDDKTVCLWKVADQITLDATLTKHEDRVTSVAFSPDGSRLASGSGDKTVCLWDVVSQTLLGVRSGHDNIVTSVAFSPDGTRLASGSDDKTVCLWKVASQITLDATLTKHEDTVTSVAFSPDGTRLASGSYDKTVCLWDVAGQKKLLGVMSKHTLAVTSVAFSPDGSRLASGSFDNTVQLWDVVSQTLLGVMSGHDNVVTSVAFSPDGTRLASGSRDKTVRLWEVANQKPLGLVMGGHEGIVTSVAFSPDGSRLASGSWDNTVRFWKVSSQTPLGNAMREHMSKVECVAFNHNGRCLASGGWDKTVRLWDVVSQTLLGVMSGHDNIVTSVAFNYDGTRLASAGGDSDKTVRLWDVASQTPLRVVTKHEDHVNIVTFSPDGTRLVSGSNDKTIRLQSLINSTHVTMTSQGSVESIAFSPDGTRLAFSDANTVCLWEVSNSHRTQPVVLIRHGAKVASVAFSSDGTRLASGSWDKTVQVWELSAGTSSRHIVDLPWHQSIFSVAFAPRNVQRAPNCAREAKSSVVGAALSLQFAEVEDDVLAIGDKAGTISFWAVARKNASLRFIGMPKHSGMPLLFNGAQLRGCKMSVMSKRLLEQHGGDIREVQVISESTDSPAETKHSPASSSTTAPFSSPLPSRLISDFSNENSNTIASSFVGNVTTEASRKVSSLPRRTLTEAEDNEPEPSVVHWHLSTKRAESKKAAYTSKAFKISSFQDQVHVNNINVSPSSILPSPLPSVMSNSLPFANNFAAPHSSINSSSMFSSSSTFFQSPTHQFAVSRSSSSSLSQGTQDSKSTSHSELSWIDFARSNPVLDYSEDEEEGEDNPVPTLNPTNPLPKPPRG